MHGPLTDFRFIDKICCKAMVQRMNDNSKAYLF